MPDDAINDYYSFTGVNFEEFKIEYGCFASNIVILFKIPKIRTSKCSEAEMKFVHIEMDKDIIYPCDGHAWELAKLHVRH
jgi:hypothetical protein